MEGNFERLNLGNPESNNYVPFDQFIQNYGITQSPINTNGISNLTVTAPEFVPINRREQNMSENGSDYVASYQPESMNRITENERKKGAIRKQYTNNNHRTYPNNQRHHQNSHHHNHNQQQYKEYNRSRYYGDPDRDTNRSYNGNNNYDNNWRRRDEIRKPPGGSQRDFHKNRNNKSERSDFKFNKYTKSQNFSSKKSPETQHPKFDTSNCSQREKLTKEIENSLLECMICCENIKSAQSVFSCQSCFHIFHLNCITKWANSSFAEGWRCPACNSFNDVVPKEYFCFCGKLKDPHYNRNDIPHSCGEVCGRYCEKGDHKCTLQCHPGPCDQCQATVTRYCNCKKSSKVMQCCQKEEIICKETCNQLLNCLIHRCTRQCHKDACGDCTEVIDQICHCEKTHRSVPCTVKNNENKSFQCQNVCDRVLNCKNHVCKEICHASDCKECQLLPKFITTCNCGKETVKEGQRTSCLDEIPVCKNICKKMLKCGSASSPHFCASKCHASAECPSCKKTTTVRCRCGHMEQEVKCKTLVNGSEVLCKKRCTKLKTCGRHKCNTDCCIDIDHVCYLTCNKKLTCGKHRCEELCHKGPCRPCLISSFDELFCECGANVIYPPVPCGTKKPACDKPCPRAHSCSHPVLHNCHTASKCPPCVILTTKYCYGKHEQRKTIPCSEESFSCGLACGKNLNCGRHKCLKVCHKEEKCLKDGDICKQRCTKTRLDCGHQCGASCHEGDCPDVICKENVEITCECGNRKQTRICHDLSREYRRITNAQLASSMMDIQNGGAIKLSEIMGPIKKNGTRTLECNDECKLLERNRRLEMAFGPSTEPVKQAPAYSDFIKSYAKKDMNLIKDIHEKLTNLVKLAKESKQKSRSHSFPVMNREKRQVVHEMCEAFGIQSQAYDAEPNRNVVATAQKDLSFCPTMSLMEVMNRENGQRIRLPMSQSAWRLPSVK